MSHPPAQPVREWDCSATNSVTPAAASSTNRLPLNRLRISVTCPDCPTAIPEASENGPYVRLGIWPAMSA